MDNDEVQKMLRGRTHELANRFAELQVSILEMEKRILDALSEHREEITKIVLRCENCGPKVLQHDVTLKEDMGLKSNGDKAGGAIDVLRSHHLKLRQIEEQIKGFDALHDRIRLFILKTAAGAVVSSCLGGGLVAAVTKYFSS